MDMKKALYALLILSTLLAAIVVLRTLQHTPIMNDSVSRVTVEVDEQQIANHLAEAIRFRTISRQRPDPADTASFEAFIAWLANAYPSVGAAMELRRAGGYTLLYRWPGQNPELAPILLTAHYDVVPVIPGSEKLWTHPPFDGVIVDGFIWGRGALDDKSAVIAQLEAATHLLEQGYVPERTIYFSFGHDEELGGAKGAGSVVEMLKQEGVRLAWSLDEGSFVLNGLFPGVSKPLASINVAEKGSVSLEIVATAAGGHSSLPPKVTAVGHLAKAITQLEANPVPGGLTGLSEQFFDITSRHMDFVPRMVFANRWLFGSVVERQLSASPFGNATLRTTTAATMLSGSVKVNVLPIEAIATVNFRVHPRDTIQDVFDHVESIVGNENVSVRRAAGLNRAASPVSDWESEGYAVIERAVREIHGDVVVAPGLMIAGSDSKHYGKIAENAFRFNPMSAGPEDMTAFHGTNEKISVHNLAQGTRTYVQIIRGGTSGSL